MSRPTLIDLARSRAGLATIAAIVLAILVLPGPGRFDSNAAGAPAKEAATDGAYGDDAAAVGVASPFLKFGGKFIMAALAFSQMFAVIRLIQGPSLADRVIALDFIGITCASMIGVYSVMVEEPLYLRAAIVLSLVSFLGTIGFALFCEKRGVP